MDNICTRLGLQQPDLFGLRFVSRRFFLLMKVLKILFLKLFYFRLNFINLSICAYKFLSPLSFAKFQKSLNFQNFVSNCFWNQFIYTIIQNMYNIQYSTI